MPRNPYTFETPEDIVAQGPEAVSVYRDTRVRAQDKFISSKFDHSIGVVGDKPLMKSEQPARPGSPVGVYGNTIIARGDEVVPGEGPSQVSINGLTMTPKEAEAEVRFQRQTQDPNVVRSMMQHDMRMQRARDARQQLLDRSKEWHKGKRTTPSELRESTRDKKQAQLDRRFKRRQIADRGGTQWKVGGSMPMEIQNAVTEGISGDKSSPWQPGGYDTLQAAMDKLQEMRDTNKKTADMHRIVHKDGKFQIIPKRSIYETGAPDSVSIIKDDAGREYWFTGSSIGRVPQGKDEQGNDLRTGVLLKEFGKVYDIKSVMEDKAGRDALIDGLNKYGVGEDGKFNQKGFDRLASALGISPKGAYTSEGRTSVGEARARLLKVQEDARKARRKGLFGWGGKEAEGYVSSSEQAEIDKVRQDLIEKSGKDINMDRRVSPNEETYNFLSVALNSGRDPNKPERTLTPVEKRKIRQKLKDLWEAIDGETANAAT